MPEVVFEVRADILYRKLSISVPRKSENLVGNEWYETLSSNRCKIISNYISIVYIQNIYIIITSYKNFGS